MRTIYLIRHGKPEFPDERKYCIGRTDLPLSEEGRTQIQALGETFAGRRIEKIYTSPLKRCRESAAILQEVIDRSIPIEVVDVIWSSSLGMIEQYAYLLMVLPIMAPPCSTQNGSTSVPPPPKLTRSGALPLITM